jgi:hypothetical protein
MIPSLAYDPIAAHARASHLPLLIYLFAFQHRAAALSLLHGHFLIIDPSGLATTQWLAGLCGLQSNPVKLHWMIGLLGYYGHARSLPAR